MRQTNHSRASFPRLQVLHVVVNLVDELIVLREHAELFLIIERLLNVRQHKSIEIHGAAIAAQWQLISLHAARIVDIAAFLFVVTVAIGRTQRRQLTRFAAE